MAAEQKSERDFMEEVAAELRGDSQAPDEVVEQEKDAEAEAAPASSGEDSAALAAERDDYKDRWIRALAEAENMRKRADRDRREAEQYGASRLARDLLPVYDNLSRALHSARDEDEKASTALLEGVELTMRELVNVFRKHGIEPIEPEVGDRFDPKLHEAMFEAPVPGTKAGDIIQVSASGFLLHNRLLRPAQVGVSSTPAS